MNILPKFKVDIVDGVIVPQKPQEYALYLKSLEDKKDNTKHLFGYELGLKPIRKKRSKNHNAYYWTVVNPVLAYEMGAKSRLDAHEQLVFMMYPNGEQVTKTLYNGDTVTYKERKKTSEMNVAQFNEFVQWCKEFGTLEFDIQWPDENEVTQDDV